MIGLGRGSGGDASEALDVSVELEAAIEAPLVGGEIALGVLWVARAAGAGDRDLDVGEARVRPPQPLVLGAAASGDDGGMLHAGRDHAAEAGQLIAEHARAGRDVGAGISRDGKCLRRSEEMPG